MTPRSQSTPASRLYRRFDTDLLLRLPRGRCREGKALSGSSTTEDRKTTLDTPRNRRESRGHRKHTSKSARPLQSGPATTDSPESQRDSPGIYSYGVSSVKYWPSRDPIGENGGINLYGMIGNDAVNKRDFLGLATIIGDDRIYSSTVLPESQEINDPPNDADLPPVFGLNIGNSEADIVITQALVLPTLPASYDIIYSGECLCSRLGGGYKIGSKGSRDREGAWHSDESELTYGCHYKCSLIQGTKKGCALDTFTFYAYPAPVIENESGNRTRRNIVCVDSLPKTVGEICPGQIEIPVEFPDGKSLGRAGAFYVPGAGEKFPSEW